MHIFRANIFSTIVLNQPHCMPLATSIGIVTRFCVQSIVKCVLIRVWSATFSADTNEDGAKLLFILILTLYNLLIAVIYRIVFVVS